MFNQGHEKLKKLSLIMFISKFCLRLRSYLSLNHTYFFSFSDPEGLIFGNVIGNDVIKLYDLRCFGKVFFLKIFLL